MMTAPFRTASLALAAAGLALSVPASALPSVHAPNAGLSAVYGVSTASYDDDDDDDDDHGRRRGWAKQERRDRYERRDDRYERRDERRYAPYRSSYQPRSYYNSEPVYRNTRVWEGNDGRYYCRKSDGTTGLLIGGAVGALLGREVVGRNGDRTLGAILGAAGGALLGKSLDSKTRCG